MTPNKITIHCAATPNGDSRFDITDITTWHKMLGWKTVGYHLVITVSGEVQRGRGLNEVGAHVKDANEGNIGICLIGKSQYTPEQFKALRYQLDSIFLTYHSIPKHAIYCHNNFPSAQAQGKTCPNMDIQRVLRWYWFNEEEAIEPYILRKK